MVDFYAVLGVAQDAPVEEIKAAYRSAVFLHHPDTNPTAGSAERQRFHEVHEAYRVLRDPASRARYDAMRSVGFGGEGFEDEAAAGGGYERGATPWGQPSMDDRDWEAKFDAWWKQQAADFDEYEERRFARERASAERMAKTAAWEWEKAEAQKTKVRAQRLKWRTEDARLGRHAGVLRRFWQTHSGVTLGDAVVAALVLAGTASIAQAWRTHLAEAQPEAPTQQQAQQQQQP